MAVDLFQSELKIYCDEDNFFESPTVSPLGLLDYPVWTTVSSWLYQSLRPRVKLTSLFLVMKKSDVTLHMQVLPLCQCGSSAFLQETVHC